MTTGLRDGSPLALDPQNALPEHRPAGHRSATTSLVVGFDQDQASRAALRFAMELGPRLQAQLHVVHTINLCDFPINVDGADWEEGGAQTLTMEREYVVRTLGAYPLGWTYRNCHGDPAATLAAAAEEHDALFVIVGRHPGGITELLHRATAGSVSRRLPGRSSRPVLLVPSHGPFVPLNRPRDHRGLGTG